MPIQTHSNNTQITAYIQSTTSKIHYKMNQDNFKDCMPKLLTQLIYFDTPIQSEFKFTSTILNNNIYQTA